MYGQNAENIIEAKVGDSYLIHIYHLQKVQKLLLLLQPTEEIYWFLQNRVRDIASFL